MAVRRLARLLLEPLEERRLLAAARFAVIGDYGDPGPSELAVANLVKSWNPDLILTTGDNNYEVPLSLETYDEAVGQYYHEFIGNYSGQYGAGSPSNRFFPSLGNHDWAGSPSPNANAYLQFFDLPGAGFTNSSGNERYYEFTFGGVHFFALSSEDGLEPDGTTAGSTQGQWLQSRLAASTAEMQVVFFHDPPYSSQGGTVGMRWPFAQWGADLVLTGHQHLYERLAVDGILYFINGLGGESIHGAGPTPIPQSRFRYDDNYGAMLVTITPQANTYEFYSIAGGGTLIDRCVQYPQASVVGRHVFYNNSSFDGNQPAANEMDDAAIAADKTALVPGQTATFANYTGFSKGINGVIVDVRGLPLDYAPAASDFAFRVGNSNDPSSWTVASGPAALGWGIERGAGGADRISVVWPDGAIKNQWLEVTLLATAANGLPAPEVFYFGNAVGEVGNATDDAIVSSADEALIRLNPRSSFNPAAVSFPFDINRDRLVTSADQALSRVNQTTAFSALRLIVPPAGAGQAPASLLSSDWFEEDLGGSRTASLSGRRRGGAAKPAAR